MNIASQDRLFLEHHNYHLPIVNDIRNLRYFVNITAVTLDGLQSASTEHNAKNTSLHFSSLPSVDFLCPKILANLIHLILSLQKAALDAIVQHFLDLMQDSVHRWYQSWLHRKGVSRDWFAEWPNGRRPLNTTWPWNIKPALLVLWGVCWMFYDNDGRAAQNPNISGMSEQDFWTRQTILQAQAPQLAGK